MKVIFYIKYHTRFGERLAIAGNAKELQSSNGYVEMQYLNDEYWKLEVQINTADLPKYTLQYQYLFIGDDGTATEEFQSPRNLVLEDKEPAVLKVYDTWNYAGDVVNTFSTAPFQKVLLPRRKASGIKPARNATHVFAVKAPLIGKD
ncbi:MAG TPA: carbohydrate-binding module family 20 domain-containing protein, partial [Niabella sp.]|nr:carbohydrate-binding module family 20 domain-containing protein [Niabella sp.]